jgi:CheY-like chemotaxis protein
MAVILIADDDETVRGLIVKIVRLSGHETMEARNGLEAVALFRSYPDSIDLIVIDLKMPVMDGHEAIRLIRESRPNAHILCVSGYSDDEVPSGAAFLAKPFTVEQVRTRVNEALAAHVL